MAKSTVVGFTKHQLLDEHDFARDRLFVSNTCPQRAVTRFGVYTLLRSSQHRLILSFYLGIGLAFTSLILKGSGPWTNKPLRTRGMHPAVGSKQHGDGARNYRNTGFVGL
jgi:hypothetical protein